MLYYSNKARRTAREKIADLHRKLAVVPLDGPLNLDDMRNLHQYLADLDSVIAREIKDHPDIS